MLRLMFLLNKNIMLVAAEDATIKRAAGFIGSMFTVNGGNLQMAGGSVTDSDGKCYRFRQFNC